MEIQYHLTEEDYLHFNLFHVKNSKTAMRALNIQRFLLPVVFIIAAYLFSKFGDLSVMEAFIVYAIVAILWIMFYPRYFYRHITKMSKRMMKEGRNEGLLGDHVMKLTDEGIVDSTSNGETKVNWSGIFEMKEDDDNIYLYNSGVSAYILPKRELKDVAEVRRFLVGKVNSSG
ncbi:YcxB family protein [Neobacillus pocheonensis]|uniref:YcxB family protein n=1 Tax=Neobacillus pocheonensis TaxID=363869 RepID=UPI003D2E4D68